uniref:NADH-ubiquinone oxidoreductase chain 2 n=1 Tax=Ricinus sp. ADS-2020 TaxID=2794903 RepID=A0A7T1HEZ9_9NEOP|nr:NADH dehydrogenase subunit 2 [Ricinus sp. ADS-2020]
MNYTFFFFFFNILSAILVVSSHSWWMMWICLELNSFFFIPWLMEEKNSMMGSKSFMYFLIQALASFIFLFCNLLNFFFSPFLSSLAMMVKLGSFPFHFWVFDIVEMMDWNKFFFFSSFMKVSPWLILLTICPAQWELMFILPFSVIIALGGFEIWSLRLILTYSSIIHMSWVIMSCCLNKSLSIFYFFSYFISVFFVVDLLSKKKINSLKELSKILVTESSIFSLFFWTSILSFLSIPPFLGFYMKFFVLKSMIYQKLLIEALLITIFSIFPIYLYLKVFFVSFLFLKLENLDFSLNKSSKPNFLIFFFFIFLTLLIWMW